MNRNFGKFCDIAVLRSFLVSGDLFTTSFKVEFSWYILKGSTNSPCAVVVVLGRNHITGSYGLARKNSFIVCVQLRRFAVQPLRRGVKSGSEFIETPRLLKVLRFHH